MTEWDVTDNEDGTFTFRRGSLEAAIRAADAKEANEAARLLEYALDAKEELLHARAKIHEMLDALFSLEETLKQAAAEADLALPPLGLAESQDALLHADLRAAGAAMLKEAEERYRKMREDGWDEVGGGAPMRSKSKK